MMYVKVWTLASADSGNINGEMIIFAGIKRNDHDNQ